MSPYDEDFQELIEQSSLGTPGAFSLRQRADAAQVHTVRQIAELRDDIASADRREQARAIAALAEHVRTHGRDQRADAITEVVPDRTASPARPDAPPTAVDQNRPVGHDTHST